MFWVIIFVSPTAYHKQHIQVSRFFFFFLSPMLYHNLSYDFKNIERDLGS